MSFFERQNILFLFLFGQVFLYSSENKRMSFEKIQDSEMIIQSIKLSDGSTLSFFWIDNENESKRKIVYQELKDVNGKIFRISRRQADDMVRIESKKVKRRIKELRKIK